MKISSVSRQRRFSRSFFLVVIVLITLSTFPLLFAPTSPGLAVVSDSSLIVSQTLERRVTSNEKNSKELCKVAGQLESFSENPKKQAELLKTSTNNGALMSQFFQDATLISSLGKLFHSNDADGNSDLIYVDLAAAWPEQLSNTVLLDRCYGWKGLCIDADPNKVKDLKEERSCQVIETCVTDTHGQTVEFSTSDKTHNTGTNGIVGVATGVAALEKRSMQCTTLAMVLDEYHIRKVDIMSLDVEGAEAMVLGGIDFTRVTIDVMVLEVEHHLAKEDGMLSKDAQRIIEILDREGYVPVLQLFGYQKGLPIQDCTTVMYGKSVKSLFTPSDALQRWRTKDILFLQKRSSYLPPLLEWIRAAGCQVPS